MKKIYVAGNYLIVDNDGDITSFSTNNSEYSQLTSSFKIVSKVGTNLEVLIPFSDISNWVEEDEITPFTQESLKILLQNNTGFNRGSLTSGGGTPLTKDAVENLGFIDENEVDTRISSIPELTKTAVENLGFVDQTQTEQIAETAAANASITPEKEAEIIQNVSIQVEQQGFIKDANLQKLVTEDRVNYLTCYDGNRSGTSLGATYQMRSTGDYLEFKVTFLSNNGFEALGVIGESNTINNSTIGINSNGLLYIRNNAGGWVSLNGSINALTTGVEYTIRLEWDYETGQEGINIYINGAFQKKENRLNGEIDFDVARVGDTYNPGGGKSAHVKVRDIRIKEGSNDEVRVFTPFDLQDQTGVVTVEELPTAFLSQTRLQNSEINTLPEFFYNMEIFPVDRTVRKKITVFEKINRNNYCGFEIVYEVKASDKQDYWRIDGAKEYEYVNRVMIPTGRNYMETGESEFVYVTNNQSTGARNSDHTGGIHGDEQLSEVLFFASGKQIDLDSTIPLTAANSFYYAEQSNMFAFGRNDTEAIHTKITTFENKGYKCFNRMWLNQDAAIAYIYHGICCVSKDCGNIVRNSYFDSFVPNGDEGFKLNTRPSERSYFSQNDQTGMSAKVSSRIINSETNDQIARMIVWDRSFTGSGDNKYYRQLIFAYDTATPSNNIGVFQPSGTVYESEMVVSFDKNI